MERQALFRKTNHLAVAGFLLPFAAAAVVGLLVLGTDGAWRRPLFLIPYLTLIPLLLIGGVVCTVKSLPLIERLNDKDYAYAGLVLNILFLLIYALGFAIGLCRVLAGLGS